MISEILAKAVNQIKEEIDDETGEIECGYLYPDVMDIIARMDDLIRKLEALRVVETWNSKQRLE